MMPGRLWKLKHFPTIDFLVMRAFDDVYELLLRGSAPVFRVCTAFRTGGSISRTACRS
jgi:hypothetical protein